MSSASHRVGDDRERPCGSLCMSSLSRIMSPKGTRNAWYEASHHVAFCHTSPKPYSKGQLHPTADVHGTTAPPVIVMEMYWLLEHRKANL
jgi:hypothetical protein